MLSLMEEKPESSVERLWNSYAAIFEKFDDLTLARWLSQTLGHLEGNWWRVSHPLLSSYRLAAQTAHNRQIWLKRLVSIPGSYFEGDCCRAPFLPIFTRDILETGLVCISCGSTNVPFREIPQPFQDHLGNWARDYSRIHEVAHMKEEDRPVSDSDYRQMVDDAAKRAEGMLAHAAESLMPLLLEHYAAIAFEDQDECLDVRPEDIPA